MASMKLQNNSFNFTEFKLDNISYTGVPLTLVGGEYMDESGNDTENVSYAPNDVTYMYSVPSDVTYSVPRYDDIIALPTVRYVLVILYITATLVATVGNFLVILLIYRKKSLRRNPAILYILNLAVCDFTSSLLWRPMLLVEILLPFNPKFSRALVNLPISYCRTTVFFSCLFSGVGFHTVAAISLERLLLICYPFHAKTWCSCNRTKKIVLFIWVITFVSILPAPLITIETVHTNISGHIIVFCAAFGVSYTQGGFVYYVYVFCFFFLGPLITLALSYGIIFHVLYKRAQVLDEHGDPVAIRSMRSRRSLAKMMSMVAILFAVAWGPSFLWMMAIASGVSVQSNGIFVSIIVEWIPIFSALLNPFIYTFNSRTFRNGLTGFMCLQRNARRADYWRSINSRQDSVFMSGHVSANPTVHVKTTETLLDNKADRCL